nr:unnamed protein product [Digitaria exilis]
MAYKAKGFFKIISRIFVVKEHEMEIGYPTDVKHVAHIGWDSAAGNASPSWDSVACPEVPRPPRKTTGKRPKDSATTAPSSSTDELASPPPAAAEDEAAVGVAANGTR